MHTFGCIIGIKHMKKQTPFLLSLDYELFFGSHSGSVNQCMILPTEKLVDMLDQHNVKVSLFVDAGFLVKLKEYATEYPELYKQYNQISAQLLSLSERGHDIQLHIHPHWQDSYYTAKGWVIDTKRYRLHDFLPEEISAIVKEYKKELELCTHNDVFAYRAGGWCIQPFDKIKLALKENGIWLDSTVFSSGHSDDPTRHFNFEGTPEAAFWCFSADPLVQDENGYFVEVPISAMKTSPLFFWKLAFLKLFSKGAFKPFGDGNAMIANGSYYFSRLTQTTYGPVMIDGAKAGQLQSAFKQHNKKSMNNAVLNVMGHPKSLSPYSLSQLELFIKKNKNIKSITYQDLKNLKSI